METKKLYQDKLDYRVGVVVLNYKSYKETLECVCSLQQQKIEHLEIIVVENGSGNESFDVLDDAYKNVSNVTLLESKENLGFARGNNVGIRFAKDNLKCDFVFVINSDTVLEDEHTIAKMLDLYKENIGVISCLCYGIDGNLANPSFVCKDNLYLKYFRTSVYNAYMVWRNAVSKNEKANRALENGTVVKHDASQFCNYPYVITGCAFMLTPAFFKYYSQLYPKTFLYAEETALAWYLKKAGLKTAYCETTKILHKEAGSTNIKTDTKKRMKMGAKSLWKVFPLLFQSSCAIAKRYDN